MTKVKVNEDIKEAQFEAVIIRADGTREDLGIVSYYHKNPLLRLKHKIKEILTNGNRTN